MTGAEYGFLLLTSQLGNQDRRPLTVAQFRELFLRSELLERIEGNRNVTAADLIAMGYGPQMAEHIVKLLGEEMLLQQYLQKAKKAGCVPITRGAESYPVALRNRLGLDSPGVLWAKGDLTLLEEPAIALVGSRNLRPANREFAKEVGFQAAKQGITLVSGNARGADKTAQDACLEAGGKVICVVADSLEEYSEKENVLYLSEDAFDGKFSARRALSRNRVIHCLGIKTFVAQSNVEKGGTWDGTTKNLQKNWSPVFCFHDESRAVVELEQMGAKGIAVADLSDFSALQSSQVLFWE